MADYDLIVRNAKIVTADRQSEGDIAVKDGTGRRPRTPT